MGHVDEVHPPEPSAGSRWTRRIFRAVLIVAMAALGAGLGVAFGSRIERRVYRFLDVRPNAALRAASTFAGAVGFGAVAAGWRRRRRSAG